MPDKSELKLSASMGIAIFPDQASSGVDLLSAADKALYEVKRQSVNH